MDLICHVVLLKHWQINVTAATALFGTRRNLKNHKLFSLGFWGFFWQIEENKIHLYCQWKDIFSYYINIISTILHVHYRRYTTNIIIDFLKHFKYYSDHTYNEFTITTNFVSLFLDLKAYNKHNRPDLMKYIYIYEYIIIFNFLSCNCAKWIMLTN